MAEVQFISNLDAVKQINKKEMDKLFKDFIHERGDFSALVFVNKEGIAETGFDGNAIGAVSVIPVQELTPRWLIERADQALYEAKGRERNRVVLGNTKF